MADQVRQDREGDTKEQAQIFFCARFFKLWSSTYWLKFPDTADIDTAVCVSSTDSASAEVQFTASAGIL